MSLAIKIVEALIVAIIYKFLAFYFAYNAARVASC